MEKIEKIRRLDCNSRPYAKVAENVTTHMDDPTGTPKILATIELSVSCHVHHRNLIPTISYCDAAFC